MASSSQLAVLLVMPCLAVTASQAAIISIEGDTTAAATFNRPVEDLSALSELGVATAFDVYAFQVDTAGEYSFLSTAAFDSMTFLYSARFDSAQPLSGGLLANDDLLGSSTSGFSYQLSSGVTYAYVTTGFENTDRGQFVATIGGPGLITAVPEPSSLVMLFGGLFGIAYLKRNVLMR